MDNLKLYKALETILSKDSEYCMDDGTLIKNKIVSDALSLNPKLLKYLLSQENLKNNFFSELDGMLIFDKVKFQQFVMNKSFLPDSYTAYKNKIGLTTEDGRFISESREVVLAWPYKDCMLEGGQTKEDAKRNEIFWSETMAPDEINRLTEPKAFTGFKRYDSEGEHDVDQILPTDNLIIKGNNLLALYSLRNKFAGKIKLIYIDPPYNTSSNADTFAYNNTFKHSTWLTFMRNRLEVAKTLLSPDGCLIVAIDENEHDRLGVLLQEMFEDYEVHSITIIHNPRGVQGTNFSYTNEFAFFVIPRGKKSIVDRKIPDEEIEYSPLRNWGTESERTDAKNCFYPITINPTNSTIVGFGDVCHDSFHPNKNEQNGLYIDVYPIDSRGVERKWRYARQTVESIKHLLRCVNKRDSWDIELGKDFGQYKTVWSDPKYDANEYGTQIIKGLVPDCPFRFPKSLWNVYDCLYAVVGKDKNAIILDFFGGSGTTAHAVIELNKDGGNRQYILVEQMDYVKTVTAKRVAEVIKREQGGSFVYCEIAKANQLIVEEIKKAETYEELIAIWQRMQKTGYLNYKINISTINESAADFAALSLDDQKRFLMECLDKNMLYIPVTDMESEEYAINDEDKRLTKEFYKKN